MPFQFTCPYCFKKTLVDESLAGQQGPCIGCGKAITVPESPRQYPKETKPVGTAYVANSKLKRGSQLKLWGLRLGGLVVGVAIAAVIVIYGFWPTVQGLKTRRDAVACMNNLQRLAQALNSYAADHGTYPTPIVVDSAGKPLYSWRVLILPYLGQANLYSSFNLDESWDSPHNANLIARCPAVFISPGSGGTRGLSEASYVLLTGPGTIFPSTGPLSPSQITDGTAETLLLVETHNGVNEWSKPFDLDVSQLNSRIGATGANTIGGSHTGGATGVFADGTAVWLPADLPSTLQDAIITANGNEAIEIDPKTFQFK